MRLESSDSTAFAAVRLACRGDMSFDVLKCQLLTVGGRVYRVVGGSQVAPHAPRAKVSQVLRTEDDEEYDLDESSFDVQQEDSQYIIRLAYDAEVWKQTAVDMRQLYAYPSAGALFQAGMLYRSFHTSSARRAELS